MFCCKIKAKSFKAFISVDKTVNYTIAFVLKLCSTTTNYSRVQLLALSSLSVCVFPDVICCSGVFGDVLSETRPTLDGRVILTNRRGSQVVVNQVPIKHCDKMATNGIVHKIDKVLPEAVNRYVTRHLRHNGRLNWHMHFGGDDFGRRLEDYVQNMLESMFGFQRSRIRRDQNDDTRVKDEDDPEAKSTRNGYPDWPDARRRRKMARQPERMWDNWRQSGKRNRNAGSGSRKDDVSSRDRDQWRSDDPSAGETPGSSSVSNQWSLHHGHGWPVRARGYYWPHHGRHHWPGAPTNTWPPYRRDYWYDWD